MTKKREHWLKSPWTISITTAIFSLLLTMIFDYLKEMPLSTTILTTLRLAGNLLWNILNFDLKIWWVTSTIILFIVILFLIEKYKVNGASKPDFYNYREGKFKRWKWTWAWRNINNEWVISDLKAHCPRCDTPLINNSSIYKFSFDCPRCDFNANDEQCDEPHKIERIIYDNIARQRIEK